MVESRVKEEEGVGPIPELLKEPEAGQPKR